MALDFRPVEIVLDALDQKTSGPTRIPGKLEHAINVEYDKTGAINKRLGYQFVDLSNTVNRFDDDAVFCALTTYRDELVVFSYDYVSGLGSRDSLLRGTDALVYRGPTNRGAVKLQHVATSETGTVVRPTDGNSAADLGQTYAGYEQGDVAALSATDGTFYRCYVWLNRNRWRIDAACYAIQPSGQPVLVFRNVIRELDSTQLAFGDTLSSPKIIPVGSTFVVHWLETDGTIDGSGFYGYDVHRATMDMEAFDASVSGWTYQGFLGVLNTHALYDACPIVGSTTDFILARYTATGNIRVERFDGFGILDTAWQTDIARTIAPRVLAVYAHDADLDVVVSYQPDAPEGDQDELWSAHLDADDGGSFAEAQTFTGFDPAQYCQVGHCRVNTNRVAVVAEAVMTGDTASSFTEHWSMRHVLYREINSDSAARVGQEHWTANLAMCSRPWAYDDGSTASGGSVNVYCVLSHKSVAAPQQLAAALPEIIDDENPQETAQPRQGSWREASIYVANLDYALWQTSETFGPTVRVRAVANVTSVGVPDARPSLLIANDPGLPSPPAKQHNHISHASAAPPFGPEIKTRTVAIGIFASMGTARADDGAGDESFIPVYEPQNAGIHGLTFYIEDPWTIFRDATDPTQPVDNFSGAYPRSMFQSVEVGKGLTIAGGTPSLYDGHQVVEIGFPWCEIMLFEAQTDPETNASGALPANLTALGTYSWYVVPTWRDGQGQIHRGQPSNIVSTTLTGTENKVYLRLRTITMSLRDNDAHYPMATAIAFEVYRTAAGGSVFYREYGGPMGDTDSTGTAGAAEANYSTLVTPVNDPTVRYIDIESGVSDTDLQMQGFAPFTLGPGGFVELTPQVVPAMHAMTVWQGRLWGADSLDESVLWYSDQILPDFGSDFYRAPEFNDTNTFRIDGVGEVVAMKGMGDALYVFTRSAIYAIRGEGNDGTGQGASFTLQPLHEGIGCIEPRSVVLAPVGIFFQSWKGYTWLDRSDQLDYLTAGAPVEDDIREAGNVRAASLKETRNQIRVACNGRPVTTYTTRWDVSVGGGDPGTWSITLTGIGAPGLIASFPAIVSSTDQQIAAGLVADIEVALADRTTQVHRYIASVEQDDDDVVVVWQPDVIPAYTDANPVATTFVATDTSSMAAQPRVLYFDYLQRKWSRAELPDVDGVSERLNEIVGGCEWRGAEGTQCYAALHQGGLRIERSERDALAYTDDSSAGAPLPVRLDVRLSPIHLAGIAGCTRVRRLFVQTSKPNASQYNVDLDYYWTGDYDDPDDVDTDMTVTTTSPSGMVICPRHQKLQAIGLRVFEPVGVVNSENVKIHSVTVLAGIKKGLAKWASAQRATT